MLLSLYVGYVLIGCLCFLVLSLTVTLLLAYIGRRHRIYERRKMGCFIDKKDDVEWDDDGFNIIVNPLESFQTDGLKKVIENDERLERLLHGLSSDEDIKDNNDNVSSDKTLAEKHSDLEWDDTEMVV